jgi:hypothetical protein
MKKILWVSSLAIVVSLTMTSTLLAKEKDDDDESADEVKIEKLILVREVADKYEPVKQFKTTDTLGVLVQLNAPVDGTKVKGVWTVVEAGELKNKKILEKVVTLDAESLKGVKVKNRIDFTLSHDNPYPAGDYKFEAYLNGELADTIEFKVVE